VQRGMAQKGGASAFGGRAYRSSCDKKNCLKSATYANQNSTFFFRWTPWWTLYFGLASDFSPLNPRRFVAKLTPMRLTTGSDLSHRRIQSGMEVLSANFGAIQSGETMGEPIHPVQLEGLRSMTPARKLAMLCDLYHAGIALRVAGIRLRHPDWPREKLEFEARRALRCAGT